MAVIATGFAIVDVLVRWGDGERAMIALIAGATRETLSLKDVKERLTDEYNKINARTREDSRDNYAPSVDIPMHFPGFGGDILCERNDGHV